MRRRERRETVLVTNGFFAGRKQVNSELLTASRTSHAVSVVFDAGVTGSKRSLEQPAREAFL
jgi:hypothetical protein